MQIISGTNKKKKYLLKLMKNFKIIDIKFIEKNSTVNCKITHGR